MWTAHSCVGSANGSRRENRWQAQAPARREPPAGGHPIERVFCNRKATRRRAAERIVEALRTEFGHVLEIVLGSRSP